MAKTTEYLTTKPFMNGDYDGNAMKDKLPTGDSLQNELNLCFQDWIP